MALRLDKAQDRNIMPSSAFSKSDHTLKLYGGSLVDMKTHLEKDRFMFYHTLPYIKTPSNFIGRTFVKYPLQGGLEHKPMISNTSSQKIADKDILRTTLVKRMYT